MTVENNEAIAITTLCAAWLENVAAKASRIRKKTIDSQRKE